MSDTPFSKATHSILSTPPFLWEKSKPPLLLKFRKLNHSPFIKRGGPNMFLCLTVADVVALAY